MPLCVYGNLYHCTLRERLMLDAHLKNGTSRRTVTMTAPLLLTSGWVRFEAVLHSYGTSPVGGGGWYRFVTEHTHGYFIGLPHWDSRLVAHDLLSRSVTLS